TGSYVPGAGAAPDQAFEQGSGLTMSHTSESIKMVVAALFLVWLVWAASATWGLFMKGGYSLPDMTQTIARATVVVMTVIWLLN
ncbi:MAG: DUF3262 family protein, partial [Burkholderiales bacterium]|nr:DUF3262 family protein [Burkholderiales bacterium]